MTDSYSQSLITYPLNACNNLQSNCGGGEKIYGQIFGVIPRGGEGKHEYRGGGRAGGFVGEGGDKGCRYVKKRGRGARYEIGG